MMQYLNSSYSIRAELESLYQTPSGTIPANSLLLLPDDMLLWTISNLRGQPVPAPKSDDMQWNQALDALSPHYIIPLLWYNLKKQPLFVLPPDREVERIRNAYRDASVRSLRTDHQIGQFTSQLRKAGIEPIILKGPALGHLVYPYPALRTGSDIDILIHPDQVQATIEIFQDLGYQHHMDSHAVSPHAFHHVTLLPSVRSEALAVEVHWRLLFLPGEITPPLEDLIKRKITVSGTCGTFSALDIHDSFIYAATHMTIGHSSMIRLSWIADMFYLAQYLTEKDEWDELFKRTSGGVLLAAIKRACKEAVFWFAPDASFSEKGFFPPLVNGSLERFSYLSAVVGRPERHLLEVFRDAKNIREGLQSAYHILFMTNEIEWSSTTLREKICFFEEWIKVVMNLVRLRISSPSSEANRNPE